MTSIIRRAVSGSRWLTMLAALSLVLAVVSFGGLFLDDRLLLDQPIWLKPFKFGISFVVYGLTLAWLMSYLQRGRRAAAIAAGFIGVAGVVELAIITAQVIRGRQSHFNIGTDLDAILWGAMGATIMVLWVGTVVVAVMVWRNGLPDRSATWSVRFGLLIMMLGLGEGFLMVQQTQEQQDSDLDVLSGAHSVGVTDGGPALPLTGWSTTGGDLRIGHFVGMHALQVLLLIAMFLPRFVAGERQRTRLMFVLSGTYAGLFVLVTWQALRGQPLINPDGLTLGALGALLIASAAGAVVALRRR